MDDYEINDRMKSAKQAQLMQIEREQRLVESQNAKAPIKIPETPEYYGGGKIWDSYKYCTAHNLRPAVSHCFKYATRAGKKDGETYEQAIQRAINALEHDLYLYRQGF